MRPFCTTYIGITTSFLPTVNSTTSLHYKNILKRAKLLLYSPLISNSMINTSSTKMAIKCVIYVQNMLLWLLNTHSVDTKLCFNHKRAYNVHKAHHQSSQYSCKLTCAVLCPCRTFLSCAFKMFISFFNFSISSSN